MKLLQRIAVCLAAMLSLVGLAIQPASAQTVEIWSAVGDSYIAAVGAGDYDPAAGPCLRSANSYVKKLVALEQEAGKTIDLRDVTCSGATVQSLRDTQFAFIHPASKVVVVSIGGNDAGFEPLVRNCVPVPPRPGVPDPDCSGDASLQVLRGLPAVQQSVRQLLKDVHARAPQAKILQVGYGQILTQKPVTVFGADPACAFFSPTERGWLFAVQLGLDGTLWSATWGLPQTSYVSPFTAPGLLRSAFVGRSLCETSDSLYHGFDVIFGGDGIGAFHPKEEWDALMANVLFSRI